MPLSIENRNPGQPSYYDIWTNENIFSSLRRIAWGYLPYIVLEYYENYYSVYIDWFDPVKGEPLDILPAAIFREIRFGLDKILAGYMPILAFYPGDGLEVVWERSNAGNH